MEHRTRPGNDLRAIQREAYVKLGKRTMFRPKELEDWAEKHAVAVPDED